MNRNYFRNFLCVAMRSRVLSAVGCKTTADGQAQTVAQAVGPGQPQAQPQAPAQLKWVTVRDTREQAFSVEVPAGWKVSGGMFRYLVVQPRPMVDMTSPDGKTNIRIGDATIPSYVLPNAYNQNASAQGLQRAAYATGDVFATKYGMARFSSMCDTVKVSSSRPMAPKYNQPGQGIFRTTGGEAIFSCTKDGQPMAGYVYSETMLVGNGSIGNWYVVALGSCLGPANQGQAIVAMLTHSSESYAANPEWTQMQQQLEAAAQKQIDVNTRATINATAAMDAHQRQMINQLQNDSFNDIINGVEFTRDPTTGATREVQTGSGGPKWIDGKNNVVDSALSPGAAFHQLQVIPRR